jgi:EAL and modified HD-GYP domain-containing signal transduction protein
MEIRRFVILVLISELATKKPTELVRMAIVRAKMCQLLALDTALREKDDEFFLLGLFSLLDAMLDMAMDDICERLSLNDPLKNALISRTGPYSPYLNLAISYEKRDKAGCLAAIKELGLGTEKLHQMYLEAISFAESVFR